MTVPSGRPPIVGIVGAGQLARMTYQAAIPLGVEIRLLAERETDAAALIGSHLTIGDPDSEEALVAFARECDVVTFDHELVNADALCRLEASGHLIRPSARTVALAQDKQHQRDLFARHGFPMPAFQTVSGLADLLAFADHHGWPVVAKSRRGGYDGRGVWLLNDAAEARTIVPSLIAAGTDLLAETWVAIDRELAVVVARRPSGATIAYPVVETIQHEGICREVIAPAEIAPDVAAAAQALAHAVAEAVDAVGVMALELFLAGERLSINEIAARPHNSGHLTIEGCETSQFEQHLRAILDWPLGAVDLTSNAAVMVNILGNTAGDNPVELLPAAFADPGVHVHLYGKASRPGRKLGHVTVRAASVTEARTRAREAALRLGTPTFVESRP